jgi:hypothetical protein
VKIAAENNREKKYMGGIISGKKSGANANFFAGKYSDRNFFVLNKINEG